MDKCAVELSGDSITGDKVLDNYNKYMSFFNRPKNEIDVDKVPHFVDTYYDLVTDMYERGWGQSFHLCAPVPGASFREAMRLHEVMAADLIKATRGSRILDVGCGIGGPMRTVASHSQAKVVGITINEYQVQRAKLHNKKAQLESLCEVVCGNFLNMRFEDDSFDGAYSIEATCHAPVLEDVYAEVFRVLKPGALYVSYEFVTTDKYHPDDPVHADVIKGIELGNAIPGLRSYADISVAARKVGFEVVEERDLALAGEWWTRMRIGKVTQWRNHAVVSVLAAVGIVPKGMVGVHKLLMQTADDTIKGGESGIFTPMHLILCRKPLASSAES